MKRILKYEFEKDWWNLSLKLPEYSYPIHFEIVAGVPTVWMEVCVDKDVVECNLILRVVGTGYSFDDNWLWCCTTREEEYMWHLIYRRDPC